MHHVSAESPTTERKTNVHQKTYRPSDSIKK